MNKILQVIPGLLLIIIVGFFSWWVAKLSPYLDALAVGILVGIIIRAIIGNREFLNPGFAFGIAVFIPLGIISYGFKMDFTKIMAVGWGSIVFTLLCIALYMTVILIIAWIFMVDRKTSILTAAGSAICGASAIAILSPVVEGESKDTSISLLAITIIGVLATLLTILLEPILNLSTAGYSFLCGATLHQTGLVKTASAIVEDAKPLALAIKMVRVAMLVPFAVVLGIITQRKNKAEFGEATKFPIPWFIFVFVLAGILATVHIVPDFVSKPIIDVGGIIFVMALTGLGLMADVRAVIRGGLVPFIAAAVGYIIVAAVAIGLAYLL
jgi:uncharacterized integral membrane protein (TIGR00698 family)